MQKNSGLVCIFAACAVLLFHLSAQANVAAPPAIANVFLELYKSKEKNISLGAMLLSVDIAYKKDLERYLRVASKKDDPPLEKSIKNYTLSKLTADYADMKDFILSFPEDKNSFQELIEFECTVTQCPHSNMLTYLISFATMQANAANPTDIALKNLAKNKVATITPLADGWVRESIDFFLHEK